MSGFEDIGHNRPPAKRREPDCDCSCGREIHHLGIMRHRAMHRDKKEDCTIVFSDGRAVRYSFSKGT